MQTMLDVNMEVLLHVDMLDVDVQAAEDMGCLAAGPGGEMCSGTGVAGVDGPQTPGTQPGLSGSLQHLEF